MFWPGTSSWGVVAQASSPEQAGLPSEASEVGSTLMASVVVSSLRTLRGAES